MRKYVINANYLPNGYMDEDKNYRECVQKNHSILTVGRLGTIQKNTKTLIEAFIKTIGNHDWTLELVGSVEKELQEYIDDLFNENPALKDRITIKGFVKDKTILAKLYESSAVFILPSRWEGGPLVVPDALSHGCFLILSDRIPTAPESTDNEKYGRIVSIDSVAALSKGIRDAIEGFDDSDEFQFQIRKFAQQFRWQNVCRTLVHYIDR